MPTPFRPSGAPTPHTTLTALIKRGLLLSLPFSAPLALALTLPMITGCDDEESAQVNAGSSAGASAGAEAPEQPSTYTFESRFKAGESSVSYSGQSARLALIGALGAHMEGFEERIARGALAPVEGGVVGELDVFFSCAMGVCEGEGHGVSLTLPTRQSTIGEISSGKDLVGKLAGNDPVGQRRDWVAEGVMGWSEPLSPEALVRSWFALAEANAIAIANGSAPLDPTGAPISAPHLTADGLHLAELSEKFLFGALALSQAADDYLDDDLEGKGLLSDNAAAEGDAGYSALEHAWDEGFGYFGAARDAGAFTAEEVAGSGGRSEYQRGHDADGDGVIDLTSEYHWSVARYAAQRDRDGGTRFLQGAFEAFLAGRALISGAGGALSDAQLEALRGHRDAALRAWEGAFAASVVHYLNGVLEQLDAPAAEWSFAQHAKEWSEMKGLALAFQFNPRSAVQGADFEALHAAIGVRPTLPSSPEAVAHRAALVAARARLGEIFGFSDEALTAW